jgi:hypothetical protein
MKTASWAMIATVALHAVLLAQDDPRTIPPDEAVVLDPTGRWTCLSAESHSGSSATCLSQEDGHVGIRVAHARHPTIWHRTLFVPFDVQRYPVLILTYRASGIQPSQRAAIQLGRDSMGYVDVLTNQDLIADGKPHETVLDLSQSTERGLVNALQLVLDLSEPGPCVFELHAIRFESFGDLPPLPKREGTEFSLRVLGTDGEAIPGAMVTVDSERLNASRSATTDAKGRVTVRALPNPQNRHSIRIAKKGMVQALLEAHSETELPETVTLLRGTRYGGTVRNEQDEPVANASVLLKFPNRQSRDCEVRLGKARQLTDASGRWQTRVLPQEKLTPTVSLWHRDYVHETIRRAPVADMQAGKAVLTLRRGHVVQGTVLRPDGTPAVGARVCQGAMSYGADFATTETGPEGRFVFPGRRIGKVVLTIQATGCAPEVASVEVASDVPLPASQLQPGHRLRGHVVDPQGEPVPGVAVRVTQWRRSHRALSWQRQTDAEGRFVWTGAPEDSVTFQFNKKGYMSIPWRPLTARAEEHEIILPPPVEITGTVTDAETGEPVASCTIIPGIHHHPRSRSANWMRQMAKKPTDGRYTIRFGNAYAKFQLKAEAPGYASATSPRFLPKDGSRTFDFRLRKAKGISGIVRLPDGAPADGTDVYLVPPRQSLNLQHANGARNIASLKTGTDGSYRFPAEKGSWLLVARHGLGYAEATPAMHARDEDLRLEAWGRIEGVCHLGKGAQSGRSVHASAQSRWHSNDTPTVWHGLHDRTDAEGRFTIDRVPSGKGTIGAQMKIGRDMWSGSHMEDYAVKPGETIQVTIGGTGRPVTGRFALPEGREIKADWELAAVVIKTDQGLSRKKPPLPKIWDKLPAKERLERFTKWLKTDDGRAYQKATQAYTAARWKARLAPRVRSRRFIGTIAADGTFRAEAIPAGDYTLSYKLRDPGSDPFTATPLGMVEHHFTVPPMAAGHNDAPLDLGTLVLGLTVE